jgi:hypothetical protein
MTMGVKHVEDYAEDRFVSLEEAARILSLDKRYAGISLRKGYLKGKVGYRGNSGRNYRYSYNDLMKLLEQTTVPAKRI